MPVASARYHPVEPYEGVRPSGGSRCVSNAAFGMPSVLSSATTTAARLPASRRFAETPGDLRCPVDRRGEPAFQPECLLAEVFGEGEFGGKFGAFTMTASGDPPYFSASVSAPRRFLISSRRPALVDPRVVALNEFCEFVHDRRRGRLGRLRRTTDRSREVLEFSSRNDQPVVERVLS